MTGVQTCALPIWLPAIGLPGLVGGASFVDVSQLAGVAWAQRGGRAIDKSHTCIAIGPEGGWSAGEQALMDISVGIFDEVLRAETAAVVAAALMANFRNQP